MSVRTPLYPLLTRSLLPPLLALAWGTASAAPAPALEELLDEAQSLTPLETVLVSRHGEVVAERGYRGHTTTTPTNSKLVISALVGIAIDRGVLEGTDQAVAPLLKRDLPRNPDPLLRQLTIGHLLSMQAGLGSTSGEHYGAWVTSRNWVRAALARPFEDEPGRRMIYSNRTVEVIGVCARTRRRPITCGYAPPAIRANR